MSANWNWLQDQHRHADEPDRQAVPVSPGSNWSSSAAAAG
jgi:hypothetical protein